MTKMQEQQNTKTTQILAIFKVSFADLVYWQDLNPFQSTCMTAPGKMLHFLGENE